MNEIIFLLALLTLVLGGAGILILLDRRESKLRRTISVKIVADVRQFVTAMNAVAAAAAATGTTLNSCGRAVRTAAERERQAAIQEVLDVRETEAQKASRTSSAPPLSQAEAIRVAAFGLHREGGEA